MQETKLKETEEERETERVGGKSNRESRLVEVQKNREGVVENQINRNRGGRERQTEQVEKVTERVGQQKDRRIQRGDVENQIQRNRGRDRYTE